MKIENDFKKELFNESKKCGFVLNPIMLDKFEKYKDLLLEWNEKINLTAITRENEIIVKHFIDCLECTKYINILEKVADIGTGAGFPGIVIAIYFENELDITLIDSLNKRLIFLEEVIEKLNLSNIKIIHGRAEDISNSLQYRQKFDVVVARAVASLNILLEYTSPYIKTGGKCIYMKGDNIKEELEKAVNSLKVLGCRVYKIYNYKLELNNENKIELFDRNIVEVHKISNTPVGYPRIYSKIKTNPL